MAQRDRRIPTVFGMFGGKEEVEIVRHDVRYRGNESKKVPSDRNYNKTLTQRDVRQLERHLSMKRTIRKKIMRDLQQASVEDEEKDEVAFRTLKDEGSLEPNVLDRLKEKNISRYRRYFNILLSMQFSLAEYKLMT